MDIILLGTGSPIPHPSRGGPATMVKTSDAVILVDAGRGVLQRVIGAGVFPPMISAVFLTHLHSDHITDLNDVITTAWVMNPNPSVLRVYGPPRTQEVVDGILAMLRPDIEYRLAHHDDLTWTPDVSVVEVRPGDEFTVGSARVTVAETAHKPVEPTVAFRIDDAGKSAVLGGDGVPCDGLDRLCRGADAYVQTVIRDDIVKMIPNKRIQDILDYHSTVEQAAQTAQRAGVKKLVLTHYVPNLEPGTEDQWRALASPHFSGEVILGDDLTTVSL